MKNIYTVFSLLNTIQTNVCRNFTKAAALTATIFLFALNANATHLMGGEISYTNVGGSQYKITLKLYRDCAGVNLGTSVSVNITNYGNVNLTRTSFRDVSILCPGQASRCVGGSAPGIQEWVYENTVNIPAGAPRTINFTLAARNNDITTISNPGGQDLVLSTILYTTAPNSSPSFLNLPIGNFCVGQATTFSPNGFDPDGDSISYSLINARRTLTTAVTYASGFSGLNPLTSSTGVSIDPATGLISFRPTLIQVAVICIKAEEFRNGVKIGEVIRDVQVRTINCGANAAPTFTAISNQTMQVGVPTCVNVQLTDPNVTNTLNVTFNTGFTPAPVFTITQNSGGVLQGTLCFTPDATSANRTFTVSLNATDNVCPNPGTAVATFNIDVPCAVSADATNTPALCGSANGTATATLTGGVGPYTYAWAAGAGVVGSTETITGLTAQEYCVTVTDANGCSANACTTVAGNSPITVGARVNATTCGLDNGSIDVTPSGGATPYSFELSNGATQTASLFADLASGDYTVTVTDALGCTQTETFNVGASADVTPPTIVCPANVSQSTDAGLCVATVDLGSPVTDDNCGVASVSNDAPATFAVGTTIVTWTVTDNTGNTATCEQAVVITDGELPTVSCKNFTLSLSAGVGTVTSGDVVDAAGDNCGITETTVTPSSFDCSNAGENTVTITVKDAAGNEASCTATVTVVNQPSCSIAVTPANNVYTGGVATNIYLGYGPQSATLTASATGGAGFTYAWSPAAALSCTNCANPVFAPTQEGTYDYTVTVTNSNGCTSTCTVKLCVFDIRVSGKGNNGKVYLCHVPQGNPNNPQLLSISVNAVPAHIPGHSGDALGKCFATCNTIQPMMAREENPLLELIENSFTFSISPNPSNTDFLLNVASESTSKAAVRIFDINGKEVLNVGDVETFKRTRMGADLNPGIFIVKVTLDGETKTTRAIKLDR